jgi:hypothetical protein
MTIACRRGEEQMRFIIAVVLGLGLCLSFINIRPAMAMRDQSSASYFMQEQERMKAQQVREQSPDRAAKKTKSKRRS